MSVPKFLSITGMVIAILIGALFLIDMVIGWPFNGSSFIMDVCFVACAAGLGYMSYNAFSEAL